MSWTVRVYRKTLFCRRRVSSDWFLDERQAKQFAEKLALELSEEANLTNILQRQPGWTLHRPE